MKKFIALFVLLVVVGLFAASLTTNVSYINYTEFVGYCERGLNAKTAAKIDTLAETDTCYLMRHFIPEAGWNYYLQSPPWGSGTEYDSTVFQVIILSKDSATRGIGTNLLTEYIQDTLAKDTGYVCPLNFKCSNSSTLPNFGMCYDVKLRYVNQTGAPPALVVPRLGTTSTLHKSYKGMKPASGLSKIKLYRARPMTFYKQVQ